MIRLRAPAKLNLYLRVLGPRPDGYHEIETIFERIDLADELTFESADALSLTSSDSSLSCGEDNLIMKAARLLQQDSGQHHGARIHVKKQIPIAAGLGGGSSDAATTLLGLNELWGLRCSRERLVELAAQLGSDAPFFLSQAALAIGRGRGEWCEPISYALPLAHVLVVPDARVSTKESYEALRQRRREGQSPSFAGSHGFYPWRNAKRVLLRSRADKATAKQNIASERFRPTGVPEGATGSARGAPQIGLTGAGPSLTMVAHALSNGPDMTGLAKGFWNDLAPEAIRRCPIISLIQKGLREAGCLGSGVSGSGPAVFGLCTDLDSAQQVAARLRTQAPSSWRIEVVQTASSSVAT